MNVCTCIKLKTVDQRLTAVQQPILASGDVGTVRVEYVLDSYWEGYEPSGTFYTHDKPEAVYEQLLTEGACVIPWEVLQEGGVLYIGLRGVDGKGRIKTAVPVRYRVEKGSPSGTVTAEGPTPDVYQQFLTMVRETEEIAQSVRDDADNGVFNGEPGAPGKTAYDYARDGGYAGSETEFAKKLANGEGNNYVTAYGAKGDGSTDDTAAFKSALAENRIVFVPGGTYKLSSGITIGDNSCLELAQDAVLTFTNTTGNCITLGMLSHLKGNHATIKVPYEFEGNVLYAYSNTHYSADINAVPPFSKWDPQWKSGRYVTDVNICKADSRGFHYAVEPTDCKGTAVYISADNTVGMLTFMWGIHYSGLRIAGAFAYGIRAENIDNGWLHEMRIDAFITACEIGVSLESCSQVYVSAIIQPNRAYSIDKVSAPYAKHGIKLVDSKNVDLSGSRIWDWENEDKASTTENEKMTLWSDGGEYQRIAMYGNCTGTIINDFTYHTQGDTRKRIYTDNDANLETLTILQEPIDRWFKVINGDPYFNSGIANTKLLSEKALEQFISVEAVKNYTDVLASATEADDTTIFNETGYQMGKRFVSLGSGTDITDSVYYMTTGFIKVKRGDIIYGKDLTFDDSKGYAGIVYYDANHNRFGSQTAAVLVKSTDYFAKNYQSAGNSFSVEFPAGETLKNLAYVRMVFPTTCVGKNPSMAINETMEATYEGFLSDSVKVKGENVIGDIGVGQPDWVAKKTESGGDLIVISEQTVSSGIWNKRQMDIIPGMTYEVYINGTRYTCEAIAYGNSGAILGNNSSMSLNNYPFSIQWAGGTATSGMFFIDSTISSPVTLKVTDGKIVEYDKMPEGYLPDGVAMKEDIPDVSGMVKSVNGTKPDASGNVSIEAGGTSIDVTAEVGQTIRVKAVDASGKPTAWEAVDLQEKICGDELGYIIPETTVDYTDDDESNNGEMLVDKLLVDGETYIVDWNGVDYTCVCGEVTADGVTFQAIGNTAILGGADTDEPFCLATTLVEGNKVCMVMPMDEYVTSFTFSVKGKKAVPIPVQYVANALPYYIEVTGDGTDDDPYVCNDTAANIKAIFDSGREIKARGRFTTSSNGVSTMVTVCYSLSLYVDGGNGMCALYFTVMMGWSDHADIAYKKIILTSQEDGTFAVTVSNPI